MQGCPLYGDESSYTAEQVRLGARETSFARALGIQLRVLWALCMREALTRFGRHNIGFLWLLGEPMVLTLGITAVWTFTKQGHGHGLSPASFALTGYSTIMLWRNPATRMGKAVEVNTALLYHRNVSVFDIYFSRLLLEIVSVTASAVVLGSLFCFFELMDPPSDLVTVLVGWGLLAWFSFGMALTVAAIQDRGDLFERFWHTITYLILPFSGAANMVEWLPPRLREVQLLLPFSHGTEMIRHGFYGEAIHTYEEPLYLASLALVLTCSGLFLARGTALYVEAE